MSVRLHQHTYLQVLAERRAHPLSQMSLLSGPERHCRECGGRQPEQISIAAAELKHGGGLAHGFFIKGTRPVSLVYLKELNWYLCEECVHLVC